MHPQKMSSDKSAQSILTSKTNNSHGGVAMRGELLLLRMPQPQMEARV